MDEGPALTGLRLTEKQRSVLAYAKDHGKAGWWFPQNTLASLERKGLLNSLWQLTDAGRAAISERSERSS